MALLLEFRHPPTGCAVVFDDDDRVAWAYLVGPEGDIIGDVWLYNRVPAPTQADWTRPSRAPFLNVAALARPLELAPPRGAADLSVEWLMEGELLLADLSLRGTLLGRLSVGSQPGWSSHALDDGPLARALRS